MWEIWSTWWKPGSSLVLWWEELRDQSSKHVPFHHCHTNENTYQDRHPSPYPTPWRADSCRRYLSLCSSNCLLADAVASSLISDPPCGSRSLVSALVVFSHSGLSSQSHELSTSSLGTILYRSPQFHVSALLLDLSVTDYYARLSLISWLLPDPIKETFEEGWWVWWWICEEWRRRWIHEGCKTEKSWKLRETK